MNAGAPTQLPLDLRHRTALGAGDFLVASSNRHAVAWLDRWPDWPAQGLFIHGPAGCGKSHLVEVWRARSGARAVTAQSLAGANPHDVLGTARTLAIDDVGRGGDETVLFHLYNMIAEREGSLLMAGARPPADLEFELADLRSRLAALPAVAVTEPDDALLAAVMVKLFADRQLDVAGEVIDYLVVRIERSFDAARRTVARLDERALELGRAITVPLAREILSL
ncbi:MAG: DnaA/Hda family protein [Alphaproteobacteria bacterium]